MSEPDAGTARRHLHIHGIQVFVRDQRSLAFYVKHLGFDLVNDFQLTNDFRWVSVTPPDGSVILALIRPSMANSQSCRKDA
jgi:catechol 2,3-dioxygenase-like lactoylglutathione lyase family enzyme